MQERADPEVSMLKLPHLHPLQWHRADAAAEAEAKACEEAEAESRELQELTMCHNQVPQNSLTHGSVWPTAV